MTISRFLDELTHNTYHRQQISGHRRLPARKARYADPERPLPPALRGALKAIGVERLYTHQALALDAVRSGKHVVIVTSTA